MGDSILIPLINDTVANIASATHRGGLISGLHTTKNVGKTVSPAILGFVLSRLGFEPIFYVPMGLGMIFLVAVSAFYTYD